MNLFKDKFASVSASFGEIEAYSNWLTGIAIWDMLYRVFKVRTWMGARGLNGSQAAAAKILKVLPNELLAVHLMYFIVFPANNQDPNQVATSYFCNSRQLAAIHCSRWGRSSTRRNAWRIELHCEELRA